MSCKLHFYEDLFFSFRHLIVEVKLLPFSFCPLCVSAEDVKRLNEKLTETSQVKMEVQLKLDDLLSSEASIKVYTRFHRDHHRSVSKLQFCYRMLENS